MEKIILCCGRGACPEVTSTDYGYEISDDFGGTVQLTEEEMRILKEYDL